MLSIHIERKSLMVPLFRISLIDVVVCSIFRRVYIGVRDVNILILVSTRMYTSPFFSFFRFPPTFLHFRKVKWLMGFCTV